MGKVTVSKLFLRTQQVKEQHVEKMRPLLKVAQVQTVLVSLVITKITSVTYSTTYTTATGQTCDTASQSAGTTEPTCEAVHSAGTTEPTCEAVHSAGTTYQTCVKCWHYWSSHPDQYNCSIYLQHNYKFDHLAGQLPIIHAEEQEAKCFACCWKSCCFKACTSLCQRISPKIILSLYRKLITDLYDPSALLLTYPDLLMECKRAYGLYKVLFVFVKSW